METEMAPRFRVNYDEMLIVPEHIIISAAASSGRNNSFKKLLKAAERFKEADLTPIYLSDANFQNLQVTTEEKLSGKYH